LTHKTRVILISVLALSAMGLLAYLAACYGGDAASRLGDTQRIADMTSRQVSVPASPRRILSICTSATATLVELGLADRIAAIDEFGRVLDGTGNAVVIGKGSMISREQVLALKIDLAFVWWYQDDAAALLDGLGVPVVRIRTGRAAEVPAMIRLVGQCMDCRDQAETSAGEVERFLRQAATAPTQAQANRPAVYLELYSQFKTVGRDSYMNDLLELAGGRNIAAGATGTVILSAEQLIRNEPDVILVVEGFATAQDVAGRPGFAELNAVRTGRIIEVDRRCLVAGPALPLAVEKLRKIIAGQVEPASGRQLSSDQGQ
jgi:iron complex transport system substrate-binding protein